MTSPRGRAAGRSSWQAPRSRAALGTARCPAPAGAARIPSGAAARRAAYGRRERPTVHHLRQSRCPGPVRDLRRSGTRPLDHLCRRAGRGPLGAGAHADVPRPLSRAWRALVGARRHRAGRSRDRRPRRPGRRAEVNEIILATSATVDGQTTAHYLTDRLARERCRDLPPRPRAAGRRRARLPRRRHPRHRAQGTPAPPLSGRECALDCPARPLYGRAPAAGRAVG